MEYLEIVEKLIGPINPVGETNEDNKRFQNLQVLRKLTDQLIYKIAQVADNCDGSTSFSIKRSGEYADSFLKELKESLK